MRPDRTKGDESATPAIAVQSHGIGMTTETLRHVSERHYRVDRSGSFPAPA